MSYQKYLSQIVPIVFTFISDWVWVKLRIENGHYNLLKYISCDSIKLCSEQFEMHETSSQTFNTGAKYYKQKHLSSALLPPLHPPKHKTVIRLLTKLYVIYGLSVRQKAWKNRKYFNRFYRYLRSNSRSSFH